MQSMVTVLRPSGRKLISKNRCIFVSKTRLSVGGFSEAVTFKQVSSYCLRGSLAEERVADFITSESRWYALVSIGVLETANDKQK